MAEKLDFLDLRVSRLALESVIDQQDEREAAISAKQVVDCGCQTDRPVTHNKKLQVNIMAEPDSDSDIDSPLGGSRTGGSLTTGKRQLIGNFPD